MMNNTDKLLSRLTSKKRGDTWSNTINQRAVRTTDFLFLKMKIRKSLNTFLPH